MKQREHEVLDRYTVLGKTSPPRSATHAPLQRVKLPKHANEATCVLTFFAIAAKGRIGEKNPHFLADIDQNGPI
jgi:hypothetical protein